MMGRIQVLDFNCLIVLCVFEGFLYKESLESCFVCLFYFFKKTYPELLRAPHTAFTMNTSLKLSLCGCTRTYHTGFSVNR